MSLPSFLIVAYRQMLSWRTNWRQFLMIRLIEPTIYFYGISLGFGHFIAQINGYDYRSFLLPGSISMMLMFSGIFEGSFSAFTRAYMQRTWYSFVATPAKLLDVMLGEMLWCAARSLISVVLLIGIGVALGVQLDALGTLLSIPFFVLLVWALMAVGYFCMSFAKSMNDFDMVFALLITPMIVFSGTMVDFNTFPLPVRLVGWCLPLTHGVAIIRPLMLGYADPAAVALHGGILVAIAVAFTALAHLRLKKRIFA
jgi:lipooligosaccharide transport system permease protein